MRGRARMGWRGRSSEVGLKRREFLRGSLWSGAGAVLVGARGVSAQAATNSVGSLSRAEWVKLLDRVARPVMSAAAEGKLQRVMPVEAAPGHEEERRKVTHLEVVGRTLAGIAPWLEQGSSDGALHARYLDWA